MSPYNRWYNPKENEMKNYIFLIPWVIALVGCAGGSDDVTRGIYHWKTTFNPTQYELQWLKDHHVQRLYLHLFDVVPGECEEGAEPVATTRFLQPLPDGMEIVPVVYIANEVMRDMDWSSLLASRIAERVMAMAACNGFEVKEVQVDCDWTQRSEDNFRYFCWNLRDDLHARGVALSTTVRLHQVDTTLSDLPVDGKVLMLYNTGDLRSRQTRNSILDYNDVEPYLNRLTPEVMDSMGLAWPVFGWGAVFDENGRFQRIVSSPHLNGDSLSRLREEWGEASTIRRVQQALPRQGAHVTVLYHLDSLNLSKYSFDEIEEFYSR